MVKIINFMLCKINKKQFIVQWVDWAQLGSQSYRQWLGLESFESFIVRTSWLDCFTTGMARVTGACWPSLPCFLPPSLSVFLILPLSLSPCSLCTEPHYTSSEPCISQQSPLGIPPGTRETNADIARLLMAPLLKSPASHPLNSIGFTRKAQIPWGQKLPKT